jgi:hypothetical protein
MPSTDAEHPVSADDERDGVAGTVLVGGLILLFAVAIVALVYLTVAG